MSLVSADDLAVRTTYGLSTLPWPRSTVCVGKRSHFLWGPIRGCSTKNYVSDTLYLKTPWFCSHTQVGCKARLHHSGHIRFDLEPREFTPELHVRLWDHNGRYQRANQIQVCLNDSPTFVILIMYIEAPGMYVRAPNEAIARRVHQLSHIELLQALLAWRDDWDTFAPCVPVLDPGPITDLQDWEDHPIWASLRSQTVGGLSALRYCSRACIRAGGVAEVIQGSTYTVSQNGTIRYVASFDPLLPQSHDLRIRRHRIRIHDAVSTVCQDGCSRTRDEGRHQRRHGCFCAGFLPQTTTKSPQLTLLQARSSKTFWLLGFITNCRLFSSADGDTWHHEAFASIREG